MRGLILTLILKNQIAMTNTNGNSKVVKNLTMIRMIYDVARECNIPFDEVFEICYNYGFCDQCGNVSSELLKQNN